MCTNTNTEKQASERDSGIMTQKNVFTINVGAVDQTVPETALFLVFSVELTLIKLL